uniref:SFRICE_007905 n=1 Tax=Spodoptera frugiperda TaxID=7108 RepID=A0A2H1VUG5_SPOFR
MLKNNTCTIGGLIAERDFLQTTYEVRVHRTASYASHATDFSLSCIETHTNASTDPHRTDRIIDNAYMRCVPMTSYEMCTMRAMRTMRACGCLPLDGARNQESEKMGSTSLLRIRHQPNWAPSVVVWLFEAGAERDAPYARDVKQHLDSVSLCLNTY